MDVPFLGRLPIYQPIREGSDSGVPLVVSEPASPAARAFLTRGRADGGAGVDRGAQGGRGQPGQDSADPGAMSGRPRRHRPAVRQAHARQRARRHRARGSPRADRGREPLVPRRVEERAARPDRLRPPLRAPDVRGLRAPRHGLLPAAAAGRRAAQRLDQHRSHQLLGSGADQRARSRAVDGVGSDGLPAAGADAASGSRPSATWC